MYYVDTSVLVTALTPEPQQLAARNWLVDHQQDLHISAWVITEFASAISIKRRVAHLNVVDAASANKNLDRYIDRAVRVLAVRTEDFRAAARWCEDSGKGLRAGDSLHLAVAANHRLTLITRDRAMESSATALGLAVQLLQEES